jgi:collagenase-like PrtC family protease
MDGKPFLSVNGTQTMSVHYANLLSELDLLRQAGVRRFRLWPQSCDMVAVAGLYRQVLDGDMSSEEAQERLADILPDADFANGYAYGREGNSWVERNLSSS